MERQIATLVESNKYRCGDCLGRIIQLFKLLLNNRLGEHLEIVQGAILHDYKIHIKNKMVTKQPTPPTINTILGRLKEALRVPKYFKLAQSLFKQNL